MVPFILDSFFVLGVAIAGRLTDDQQRVIDYLVTENRILREMLEGRGVRRLRFTDNQRRRGALPRAAWWVVAVLPPRGSVTRVHSRMDDALHLDREQMAPPRTARRRRSLLCPRR